MSDEHSGDHLTPSPAPDIARREIAGETILVPVAGELARLQEIFVLDEVADHIWQQLDGATPIDGIVASITATFEVDAATARRDLLAFVRDLEAAGLVAPTADTVDD
jgi:hypothetical protein